jgi:hypothetical protein
MCRYIIGKFCFGPMIFDRVIPLELGGEKISATVAHIYMDTS